MFFGRKSVKAAPSTKTPLHKKVEFEFFAPHAKSVGVVGSFTGWEQNPLRLQQTREGRWSGTAELPSGRHEYRFLVDGSWQNDQKPVECVKNPFGSTNCVLVVGKV